VILSPRIFITVAANERKKEQLSSQNSKVFILITCFSKIDVRIGVENRSRKSKSFSHDTSRSEIRFRFSLVFNPVCLRRNVNID